MTSDRSDEKSRKGERFRAKVANIEVLSTATGRLYEMPSVE